MSQLEMTPIAETFGREVKGVSLKDDLNTDVVNGVLKALTEHSLLLFRNQNLEADDQNKITNALGALCDQRHHVWTLPADPKAAPGKTTMMGRVSCLNRGDLLYFQNGPGLCEGKEDPTAVVDEEDREDQLGTSCWHTDDTEKFDIEATNILYSVIAPRRAGQTWILDSMAAFEELDKATQARLEPLRMIHIMKFPPPIGKIKFPPPTTPVSQPVVKQHPVTGRKHLYLNFYDTDRVEGFSRKESDALVKMLFDHVTQPRYRYAHSWQEGDLLIWNNNGTCHKRGPLASGEKRVLRRTQAIIPALQSVREHDKSRAVKGHDGEMWHPYPFKQVSQSVA